MRKLRIGVIDVIGKSASRTLNARTMRANLSSIMPQVVAVWCEEEGHDVYMAFHSGYLNMIEPLPDDLDMVFISSFTLTAQIAYALSNFYRSKGAVTVLGGPHARSYPEDARKYFDYVLGFTDKAIIRDVLQDAEQHRPMGLYLAANQQPTELPGVRARWKYIERLLQEAFSFFRAVPMIGSTGCPYTCSFCVDSVVPYQPLDFDVMKDDLRFLLTKFKRPKVGWHDPNFGVRFNDYLDAIEEAIPPNSIDFIAESTLSLLSEKNVIRLKKNGFKAILPGIESWYDMGYKSKTGKRRGLEKVEKVAEQVNMIMSYIPYMQANFVFGLDCDAGTEPFELTKKFIELAPGVYPTFNMLTAYGQSAPLNLEYQKQDRLIPFPFHFLTVNSGMNVRIKNYEWTEFYDLMLDINQFAFAKKTMYRRFRANKGRITRLINVVRGMSDMSSPNSKGWGKIRFFQEVRRRLDEDVEFRKFFEQETTVVPQFFIDIIKRDLGPLWEWLPEGALYHDPYTYLKTEGLAQPDIIATA